MSDLFMWGGFGFCVIYHVISYVFIFSVNNTVRDGTLGQHLTNIGVSGIGLCYFGMQSFG